jgi:hypothetical protein
MNVTYDSWNLSSSDLPFVFEAQVAVEIEDLDDCQPLSTSMSGVPID